MVTSEQTSGNNTHFYDPRHFCPVGIGNLLVELETYYKSLQDRKSEIRRRVPWAAVPVVILFLIGYFSNSYFTIYLYVSALFGGFITVVTYVNPLGRRERAFEKAYLAIELAGRQSDRASRRKLRRFLKSVLSLPIGTSSTLLSEDIDEHRKMDELIKRRLLPAASAGKVKETTVEMLAELLKSPTVAQMKAFNEQLSHYDDVTETTFRNRLTDLQKNQAVHFAISISVALLLGFAIGYGSAYLVIVEVLHLDFLKYAGDPTFGAAIFAWGGALTGLIYNTEFKASKP